MGGHGGDQPRPARDGSNLLGRGFLSLLVTQFLGAANDNILKQVLVFMVTGGLWANALGPGGQATIGLCLNLPFLIFSGYGGQWADRISKQRVAVWMKVAEIPIVVVAGIGLWTGQLWVTIGAFVLMATQSTFFGPAKYGVIPELVREAELSKANGLINMLTNVAIIVGTLIAGPVTDHFYPTLSAVNGAAPASPSGGPIVALPDPSIPRSYSLPLIVMVAVAVLGLLAVLFMPRMTAKDPQLKFNPNPVGTYWRALREMSRGPLIWVAIGWSWFSLVGMAAILLLPEYKTILGTSYTQNSYLLGILAISIGIGSAAAGWISGNRIEPRLVPFGALGMTVGFLLLGVVPPTYVNVVIFSSIAGLSAGFYVVPLQALLQDLAPPEETGRVLGTANALSAAFAAAGSAMTWVAQSPMHLSANRSFILCAALSLLGAVMIIWRLRTLKPRGR